jgi:hypothetical protein
MPPFAACETALRPGNFSTLDVMADRPNGVGEPEVAVLYWSPDVYRGGLNSLSIVPSIRNLPPPK